MALLVGASAGFGVSTTTEWTGRSRSLASHSVRLAFPSVAIRSNSHGSRREPAFADGPNRIWVRPPTFSGCLPSLEESFAYVDLRRPVALSVARLSPPVVTGVGAPTFEHALPKLEEGFLDLWRPVRAYQMRQRMRAA